MNHTRFGPIKIYFSYLRGSVGVRSSTSKNKLSSEFLQSELSGVYWDTHIHILSCQSHCASVACKSNNIHCITGDTQKPCFDQCFYLVCYQNAGLSSSSAFVCCSGLVTMHANGGSLTKVSILSLTFVARDHLVSEIVSSFTYCVARQIHINKRITIHNLVN